MLKNILSIAAVMSVTVSAIHHHRRPRHLMANQDAEGNEVTAYDDFGAEQWFENKLHHTSKQKSEETYLQRYWNSTRYWNEETGPVFVYICGEWTCSPPSWESYTLQMAKEYEAHVFVLEHRFFGKSQPFEDWSTSNLHSLTSEEALADLAYFIDSMNEWIYEQTGRTDVDWITVGGSYPGALSAWFKHLYPNHAVGAWSSSGVIDATFDFNHMDLVIFNSTKKSGDFCPVMIHEHYKYVEKQFRFEKSTQEICDIFGIPRDELEKETFFYYLADFYVGPVQEGMRTDLCDFLSTLQGQDTKSQIVQVSKYGREKFGMAWGTYSTTSLQNTTIDTWKSSRQWTYMYCNEFAFFQTPNNVFPLRSEAVAVPWWPEYCKNIYGEGLPALHVEETNKFYGGLDITGDNIFFGVATEDPWSFATMRQLKNPFSTQQTMQVGMSDCENCAHCVDLDPPRDDQPAELTATQEGIRLAIGKWLNEATEKRAASASVEGFLTN